MIYDCAGAAGLDPGPHTLRELAWMAEARARARWSHTASILCLLFNCNRGRGAPAKTPADFNPWERPRKAPATSMKALGNFLKSKGLIRHG